MTKNEFNSFMLAIEVELRNVDSGLPTIIPIDLIKNLRDVADKYLSKGQTGHVHGKREDDWIPQDDISVSDQDGQGVQTKSDINCPVCDAELTVLLRKR